MRIAMYPGRFDPVTNGHLDIIERGASLFDRLLVAPVDSKSTLFSTDDRVRLIEQAVAHMKNVDVRPFSGLMVNFARSQNVTVVVRGMRAVTDFYAEFDQALMNRKMAPEIESCYLITRLDHLFISASRIREVAGLGYDVSEHVPSHVAVALKAKFAK